jgi:hypothetical protein
MQFIKNGPDIPERLLQAHEDGRVVLFCGAGISFPAGLPGFRGLVDRLYARLGATPSPAEKAAIKHGQFDTAIGLLEQVYPGGRAAVRPHIAEILTPDLSKPQAIMTHEALLILARSREGRYRVVTTNFDRLFAEVIERRALSLQTFDAPLLPVPKNRLDGLVYLHGVLTATPTPSDLDRLVVSSGDFGLAYLTERWAARFVTDLFRNYVVCFVGYSINDPVLRYMMDALAADRLLGESPSEMFAFGSYSKGEKDQSENEWKAKNVTPILYREHNAHAYLHKTLRAWADTYRDGVLGKERMVTQYATAKPLASTTQDDFVGRMLWALSDQLALPAKRFAEFDPVPSLDWLESLSATRFRHDDLARFGVTPNSKVDDKLAYSLVRRPAPYARAPSMALVARGHSETSQWDDVMLQLARWLTRHLNEPKLILWLAKQGGFLNSQFARLITDVLDKNPPSPPMSTLWGLMLAGRLRSYATHSNLYDWRERFKHNGLTPTLRVQLRDLLGPRVRLREPFLTRAGHGQDTTGAAIRVKDLVDWEVVLGVDHVHSALKDLAKHARWQEALLELLADATGLLRDALDLMRELGGVEDRHDASYIHQPSISDHPQNRDYRDWTALIELVRDAWVATAARSPERAQLEVQRWIAIPYPLFRRLVLFAATDTSLFQSREALHWLLMDEHWWLWSVETQREALRLLVTIAPQLDAQNSEILEHAVVEGPPRAMFDDDVETVQLQRIIDREVWLRLAKYRVARNEVGVEAATRLSELSAQYPEWRLADDAHDEFPVWMGDSGDLVKFKVTPKHRRDLVIWLRENPNTDHWHEDDWRERCKRDFPPTASALLTLAQNGEWFKDRWREALQAWADEKLTARSWRYMGRVLATAPVEIIKEFADSLSTWLQAIAKSFHGNEADFFILIKRFLALYAEEEGIEDDDDPVLKAINHPIGHVTEAALRWWYRQSLEDNQRLPDVLTEIFTELCKIEIVSFRHGRLLLATHVITLFRVDREWTTRYLLPVFDWERSREEARGAWTGFLWSPRLYHPLMEAMKPQFLATAQYYSDLGQFAEQYAAFLTFAALEHGGDIFSRAELAVATRSLPEDGLHSAAEALVRALDSAGERTAQYWRNRILPYLKYIWPKSRNMVTPAISESFARLCIAAQDAFPEAVNELKYWLQPIDFPDSVINLLDETKLCDRFPEPALAFLKTVIDDTDQWPPRELKDCLDAIKNVEANLENDERFQRLWEYLRRRGIT